MIVKMMVAFSEYVLVITAGIFAGLFSISLLQFSTVRKNNRIQVNIQIYTRIIETRNKLEGNEVFIKMAKENPLFAE
jgi:hypothetical protein